MTKRRNSTVRSPTGMEYIYAHLSEWQTLADIRMRSANDVQEINGEELIGVDLDDPYVRVPTDHGEPPPDIGEVQYRSIRIIGKFQPSITPLPSVMAHDPLSRELILEALSLAKELNAYAIPQEMISTPTPPQQTPPSQTPEAPKKSWFSWN